MELLSAISDKSLIVNIQIATLVLLLLRCILDFATSRRNTPASPPPPPPQVSLPSPHKPYEDISKRLEGISKLLPRLRWIAAQDSDGTNPSHADLEEVRRQVPFIALQVAACQIRLFLLESRGGDDRAEGEKNREEVEKLKVHVKIATEAGLRYLRASDSLDNGGIAVVTDYTRAFVRPILVVGGEP